VLGWDGTGRLLDVGCGPGIVALELAPSFADVIGLDPEEQMLAEARKRASAAGRQSIEWVQARAEEIPDRDLGRFQAITLGQSLHWTDRARAVDIVHDALIPGGAMVLIHHEPNSPPPRTGVPAHPRIPHDAVNAALIRYLGRGKAPWDPTRERHDAFLARTRFGPPERVMLAGRVDLVRTIDEVIDAYLGTSFAAPELFGDRLEAFRAELGDTLRSYTDTGLFWDWPGDTEVLIARRRD
jgi:SAM-dependent methyltransferase